MGFSRSTVGLREREFDGQGDPPTATVPLIAPTISSITLSGGGPYTPTAATVSWTTTSTLSESMQVLRSLDGGPYAAMSDNVDTNLPAYVPSVSYEVQASYNGQTAMSAPVTPLQPGSINSDMPIVQSITVGDGAGNNSPVTQTDTTPGTMTYTQSADGSGSIYLFAGLTSNTATAVSNTQYEVFDLSDASGVPVASGQLSSGQQAFLPPPLYPCGAGFLIETGVDYDGNFYEQQAIKACGAGEPAAPVVITSITALNALGGNTVHLDNNNTCAVRVVGYDATNQQQTLQGLNVVAIALVNTATSIAVPAGAYWIDQNQAGGGNILVTLHFPTAVAGTSYALTLKLDAAPAPCPTATITVIK